MNIDASYTLKILRRLDEQPMAEVYLVQDELLDRKVILRVLREKSRGSKEMMHRFLREAQLTSRLQHPHIPPVFLYGINADRVPFMIHPMFMGTPLITVLNQIRSGDAKVIKKYPLSRLLDRFTEICRTMAYAHSYDVIHRNLSTDAILLGRDGGLLVAGWDLAKDLKDRSDEHAYHLPFEIEMPEDAEEDDEDGFESGFQTMAGVQLGDQDFMAPEQARGETEEVDERADIYGLGGILYTILTLRSPSEAAGNGGIPPPQSFGAKGLQRKKYRFMGVPNQATLPHCPEGAVPDAFSRIALRALADDVEARYRTIKELISDLEEAGA